MLENVPLAQFTAYTTLTIASVIVAIVSLRFSYRQNFGWKPVFLGRGFRSQINNGKLEEIRLDFDFWNRRPNSVVIKSISIEFTNLELVEKLTMTNRFPWVIHTSGKAERNWKEDFVKGGEHLRIKFRTKTAPIDFHSLNTEYTVKLRYFNPRSNKSYVATIRDKLHSPYRPKDSFPQVGDSTPSIETL